MRRGRGLRLALGSLPLLFALFAVPVGGQGPTVTVTSPAPGEVVAGAVQFQGTAEAPDAFLQRVDVAIEGVKPSLKYNFGGNQASATWELTWNSQGVLDGRWAVSVTARDKDAAVSAPVEFSVIVDNDPEPRVVSHRFLFDAEGDGGYAPWNDPAAVPTTRLALEIVFSEEMDPATLGSAVSLAGAASSWEREARDRTTHWLTVSHLEVNASYTLQVDVGARDLAGNPLQEAYEVVFTTTAEPTPGTPEGPGTGLALPVGLDSPWLWVGVGSAAAGVAVAVAWRKGLLAPLTTRLGGLKGWMRGSDEESPYEGFREDDE